ncbi:putative Phosphohistidine phosphatase SixA [Nostocoides japonicum T1-X7]|uniref:Putative Phosphohistidine phosphatase SixA n=1 Tax=Nostocoides japonicum T1-X7 TaxID=1194083 RepID=A0A077M691_9MICO|nr:histidine phosphatase family protein [Tetrasphaera japonica]CCH79565.1 putative Phosphohistidine phosphatase SixA [Tetrasphaera japonica T1-X7]
MTRSAEDRTLVLVRHAKAEQGGWDRDHERTLTGRGHRDAVAAGRWLCDHGIGCDEVLCSTAARARQTADGIAEAGCCEAEIQYDAAIYNASAAGLLGVLREADPEAQVLMMVGHAPGIPQLASLLADGEGREEAHDLMSQGWPTSGVAVLRYDGHWSDLDWGTAYLQAFAAPRG